jgi:hypothetical protein
VGNAVHDHSHIRAEHLDIGIVPLLFTRPGRLPSSAFQPTTRSCHAYSTRFACVLNAQIRTPLALRVKNGHLSPDEIRTQPH